jgi:hypothetical protein
VHQDLSSWRKEGHEDSTRDSAVKYSFRKNSKEGDTVCLWLDNTAPRSRFQTCRHAAHLGAGDIKGETRVSGV